LSASRADWTVLVVRTVWPVTRCDRVVSGLNASLTPGRGSEARLDAVHMPTARVERVERVGPPRRGRGVIESIARARSAESPRRGSRGHRGHTRRGGRSKSE
jgi:hypothetical protein